MSEQHLLRLGASITRVERQLYAESRVPRLSVLGPARSENRSYLVVLGTVTSVPLVPPRRAGPRRRGAYTLYRITNLERPTARNRQGPTKCTSGPQLRHACGKAAPETESQLCHSTVGLPGPVLPFPHSSASHMLHRTCMCARCTGVRSCTPAHGVSRRSSPQGPTPCLFAGTAARVLSRVAALSAPAPHRDTHDLHFI